MVLTDSQFFLVEEVVHLMEIVPKVGVVKREVAEIAPRHSRRHHLNQSCKPQAQNPFILQLFLVVKLNSCTKQ